MKFAVPQFIDVEDKIFGPLTLKQGIYLIGSAGAAFLTYSMFGYLGVVFLGLPIVLMAIMFAFIRVNNRPFVSVASAAFFYTLKKKLYLWKKVPKKQSGGPQQPSDQTPVKHATPALTQSKLKALAFSLDTENGYQTENE